MLMKDLIWGRAGAKWNFGEGKYESEGISETDFSKDVVFQTLVNKVVDTCK
jgi:hypothetical protein